MNYKGNNFISQENINSIINEIDTSISMKTDDLNISLVNLYEEMKLYISNFIKSFNEKNVNEMVNNLELILRFQCKYSSDIIELFIKSCVLFYFVKIIQERSLFPNPHIIDLVVSVLLLLANN